MCDTTCWRKGITCGLHRIECQSGSTRLKHARARIGYRLIWVSGRPQVVLNMPDRVFTAPDPNRRWIVDFTYIWTVAGWLYAAVVACSRAGSPVD